jgi:hypothetical protein
LQTIGAMSRHVGFRLGRHLKRIVPIFIECLGDPNDEAEVRTFTFDVVHLIVFHQSLYSYVLQSSHSEAANELRENCFQAFESFLLRSPKV